MREYSKVHDYIPRSSWVGTDNDAEVRLCYTHRYPLTKRAGFAFNRIVNTCPNAMAHWSLVTQGRATATKHVRDTLSGHRSHEVVGRGGESLKQHRLRPINKSAQVNSYLTR